MEPGRKKKLPKISLAAIPDMAPDGIALVDRDGSILFHNPAFAQMHGYSTEEIEEMVWEDFYPEGSRPAFNGCLEDVVPQERWRGELVGRRRDGSRFYQEITASRGDGFIVCICRDISIRKEMEEKLTFASTHDYLTQLYNRAYFEEELARMKKSRLYPLSVIIVDVDGLKSVNDTCGHHAGDRLLVLAAQALREAFRGEDVVARVGGDEFAVLLPEADAAAATAAENRIRKHVARVNERSNGLNLSLSIGSATALDCSSFNNICIAADEMMYRDKVRNRNWGKTSVCSADVVSSPETFYLHPPLRGFKPYRFA